MILELPGPYRFVSICCHAHTNKTPTETDPQGRGSRVGMKVQWRSSRYILFLILSDISSEERGPCGLKWRPLSLVMASQIHTPPIYQEQSVLCHGTLTAERWGERSLK